jgi:protein SCO1/2
MPVRPKVLVAIAIVAVAAGVLLASAALSPPPEPPQQATVLPTPRVLPELALLDQDAQPFDRKRLEQHWSLVFFGFTRCPAICPTTLTVLAQTRAQLASLPAAQRPQVVLVSVDPQYDSPAQLKSYVSSFGSGLLGVTGTDAAIRELGRSLGVSITMRPLPGGDYTVDHTTAIFLVDPRGAWRAVFSSPHSADVIADDYRRILAME